MPHIRGGDGAGPAKAGPNTPPTDFLYYLASPRQWQALLEHGVRRERKGRGNPPLPVRLLAKPADWRGPRKNSNPVLLVQVDALKVQLADNGARKAQGDTLHVDQDIPLSAWRQVLLKADGRTVRVWPPGRVQKEDMAMLESLCSGRPRM